MLTLHINGQAHTLDADPEMPILWALRDLIGLTGTKFGCGMALCGACTVLLDGEPVRSCSTPLSEAIGKSLTTIEGVPADHPVKQAWCELNVPQCGYCQSGQIMSALALIKQNSQPSDTEINDFMRGNICRCGTYPRIRAAIKLAGKGMTP